MKDKKIEIRLRRIMLLMPVIFICVPYFFIFLLDMWQARWFFGLTFALLIPIMPLYLGLNPKIQLTAYNPKEMPRNRYILRHLGIVFRVLILFVGLGFIFYVTPVYVKSSIQLAANGWQPDSVTGTLVKFEATAPKNLILRDIFLKESDRKLSLIYPFGKRPHKGMRYEFLVLPGTNIVVDIKELNNGSVFNLIIMKDIND